MQQVLHKKTAHGIVFISLDADLPLNLAMEIDNSPLFLPFVCGPIPCEGNLFLLVGSRCDVDPCIRKTGGFASRFLAFQVGVT